MANVIRLRKGLNINLKGKSKPELRNSKVTDDYAVSPADFVGVIPKLVVHEGDHVKAGDALFFDKNYPDLLFSSPISGNIVSIVRGDRRKILFIKIKADEQQEYVDFGVKSIASLTREEIVSALCKAGIFGFITQLPYAVVTSPLSSPKAIFVSALRDMPLAADFDFEVKDNVNDFKTGMEALSKIAPTFLGIGKNQQQYDYYTIKDVTTTVFDGPCPAGNVDVHINHLNPVNKGEIVWTVDPSAVVFFGRLFNTGRVDLSRVIALAGSQIKEPCYYHSKVGASLSSILDGQLSDDQSSRIIKGNPLTGTVALPKDYFGAHTSEISVIPEGSNANELFGWIMPRFNQFSVSRSYFSWLLGRNKTYDLDARIKGGERHMIMSGEYDKVLPMDIYGEFLIKSIIAEDIDKMEQLGIYEVSPEDFALAEFVDSSKLELQRIVRTGLDMLRKENS